MRRDPNSESSLDYWYDCSIIYKQGFDVVLELKYGEYEIDVNSDNTTIISANLSPEQTLKFDDTVLDTYVQLKMKTVDGLTQYGRPVKLHVFKPLDCDSLV